MKRAMVVDDDCSILKIGARWLTSAGYEVETAAEFDEARCRIETSRPDVLIVDVRLRNFNGLQLAILARVARPDIHVVMISGWDDPVLRREANACGAAFVCKPFSAAQLLEAIGPNDRPHSQSQDGGRHQPTSNVPRSERRRRKGSSSR
jgi:DNA-binding response OmpR family regulator